MVNYLEQMRNKARKITDRVKGKATQVRQEIEEQGAGQYATNAAVTAGGKVGELYARANNAVSDDYVDPAAAARKGREVVAGGIEKTCEAAATARDRASDLSDKVRGAAGTVKDTATAIKDGVVSTYHDYASTDDRIVVLGKGTHYIVNSVSKDVIGHVRTYLTGASKAIPSNTEGREDVLRFIADRAITDYETLRSEWMQKGYAQVNALKCLAPKE